MSDLRVALYFGNLTTESLVRPEISFTSRIVLHLLEKVDFDYPAEGRLIYTDCFYTGVDLVEELKIRILLE